MPPLPVSIFLMSSLGYLPEKASATKSPAGMVPARSGAIGPFAVQGVVHVHDPALLVGADGYAAAEVTDDQVDRLVFLAQLPGRQPGRVLVVEGVKDAPALDFGNPVRRAQSSNSSTTTGSTMKAGMPRGRAISSAIRPPRFEACSPWTPL